MLRNYAYMMGSYFLFFLILGILSSSFPSLDLTKYRQTDLFRMLDESPLKFAFMAVIVAPILEEGVFRSLIKPSKTEILIFICSIIGLSATYFMPTEGHWILKLGLIILSLIIIFLLLNSAINVEFLKKLQNWLNRNYKWLWLITSLLFGLVHIGNYVDSFQINIILILLIIPRIIAGFFFGKIKIENKSLIWPIIMHAMNNGIIVFFLLPKFLN